MSPSDDTAPPLAATPGRVAIRVMLGISTTILALVALSAGEAVVAPLAFALFIIAIVWPLQELLQRHLPQLVALAICMIATIAVMAVFGWIITWGFTRVIRYIIGELPRLQLLYSQAAIWLEGHGIAVDSIWSEHFSIGWALRSLHGLTGWLQTMISFSIVVLIYVILGLLEIDIVARKLAAMRDKAAAVVLLNGTRQTSAKLRRYMLVRTLMSILTGGLVWVFVSLCGLPLALEWGVIAFAFNYIPFIGPLVATVMPTLFAATQFEAWQTVLLVFAALNLIQFMVGSYLEPRIAGSVLSMSPLLVLFSVFSWTFLWGLAGAFIGVPIVIAVLTLCDQHPSGRWVAALLGGPDGEPA